MRANFEVFPGIFINVWPTNDTEPSDLSGQRNRSGDASAGQFGRFHYLYAGLIKDFVVKGLENDSHLMPGNHNECCNAPEF